MISKRVGEEDEMEVGLFKSVTLGRKIWVGYMEEKFGQGKFLLGWCYDSADET